MLSCNLRADEYKNTIRRVFREGMMRQSVIYQEIFQEGEQVGEARGEARGRQAGQRSLLLLDQRIGQVSVEQTDRISQLNLDTEGSPSDRSLQLLNYRRFGAVVG